jgi:hypothetical protein
MGKFELQHIDWVDTKTRIGVYEYLSGPNGMRFTLYPVSGVNTKDQVYELKCKLRKNRDTVRIDVQWIHPKCFEKYCNTHDLSFS